MRIWWDFDWNLVDFYGILEIFWAIFVRVYVNLCGCWDILDAFFCLFGGILVGSWGILVEFC